MSLDVWSLTKPPSPLVISFSSPPSPSSFDLATDDTRIFPCGLACSIAIFSFLDPYLSQWACLRQVCRRWRDAGKTQAWVSLLWPRYKGPGSMHKLQTLATQLPGLHNLRMQVTYDQMPYLPLFTRLRSLELCGPMPHTLNSLSVLTTLQNLSLKRIKLGAGSGVQLLSRFTRLRRLEIESCGLMGEWIRVGALPQLHTVAIVELFQDEDFSVYEWLESLPRLQKLRLYYRKIDDMSLEALTPLKMVHSLSLTCDHMTDEGLLTIARLSALKVLELSNATIINDEGLQILSRLTNLKKLRLQWFVLVTSEGAKSLARCLPNLELLDYVNRGKNNLQIVSHQSASRTFPPF